MEETQFDLGKGSCTSQWMKISNSTPDRIQGLPHEALDKFCLVNSLSESIPIHNFPSVTQLMPVSSVSDLSPAPFQDFGHTHCGFGLVQEKKLRRMMSNRESARRSRLRKKKQIEDLQFQVDHLRNNKTLMSEKLLSLFESNRLVMEENAQLKEKVASLQVVVSNSFPQFQSNTVDGGAINVGSGSSSTKSVQIQVSHASYRRM